MKAVMLKKEETDYLDYHLMDGLDARIKGIDQLQQSNLISLEEAHALVKRAAVEHIMLWRTFKLKLLSKALSVFFAGLFLWMQSGGEDLEMRRTTRVRTSSSRAGRRRNES